MEEHSFGKTGRHVRRFVRWFVSEYDYALAMATVGLVAAIGLLFVGGTLYTFFAASLDPYWTQSPMYASYVGSMNSYLLPLLVALVLTLGLCIPRRIFTRRALVAVSLTMLVATIALLLVVDLRAAWTFLLSVAAAVQVAVIIMTALQSKKVNYLQEGFLVRMGSAILHLGFIVLVAAFVLGLGISHQLAAFWVATALIMLGTVMSFYSKELTSLGRRRRSRTEE